MATPAKKTTRRVGTTRQTTATQQYVSKATKGRVNPLFWVVGGMGGVLAVVTVIAFWPKEPPLPPPGSGCVLHGKVEERGARLEDEGRFSEAADLYIAHVECLTKSAHADVRKVEIINLKARAREAHDTQAGLDGLLKQWTEWKAGYDGAKAGIEKLPRPEAKAKLQDHREPLRRLLEAVPLRKPAWTADAVTCRQEIDDWIARLGVLKPWAQWRNEMAVKHGLGDREKGSWGAAVKETRDTYLAQPDLDGENETQAGTGIKTWESQARDRLMSLKRRAEGERSRKPLEDARRQFAGCAVEAELDAVLKTFP